MCASGMTGDLCDTLITILNSSTSISGGNQRINVFSLQIGLFQRLCQRTVCTNSSTCTCRQDNAGNDFMFFIQNYHICTCRTTVNSCKITFSHFSLSFCVNLYGLLQFLRLNTLCKSLQPGKKLTAALNGII